MPPEARATLVIVPRERWSFARQSLEDIFAHTRPPYDLVYLFADGPAPLRRELEGTVTGRGFRFVDVTGLHTPNRARNQAAGLVKTEYTVFIDNDIVVGIGPAGTGKTYLAVAMAVSALLSKRVSRIILTRPAWDAR